MLDEKRKSNGDIKESRENEVGSGVTTNSKTSIVDVKKPCEQSMKSAMRIEQMTTMDQNSIELDAVKEYNYYNVARKINNMNERHKKKSMFTKKIKINHN